MCGIFGALGDVDVDVAAMQGLASRRGPDVRWHMRDRGIVIGMARLRVQDVSASGDPPWLSSDRRITAVFNGELTNHRELREELARRGHEFESGCDGHLIPALYQEFGAEFLAMLAGPFALAVWDGRRRQLLLARDRLGKKPLMFATPRGGLVFASDLRTLAASRAISHDADPAAVAQFLRQGFVRAPASILAEARTLPPGHALRASDREIIPSAPFATVACPRSPRMAGPTQRVRTEFSHAVSAALASSVRARLESSRPTSVLLSGGLDSGLVASFARDLDPAIPCVTVRTGWDASEVAAAQATARHLGLPWRCVDLSAPDAAGWRRFVADLGDPIADSSAFAGDAVFRALAGDFAIVLSGDGGDELFFGYRRMQALTLSRLPIVQWLSRLADDHPNVSGEGRLGRSVQRLLSGARRPELERLAYWRELFGRPGISALLPGMTVLPEESGGDPAMDELCGPLAHGLLAKVDRTSMAHGIEVRCPFLDERVVALALQAPRAVLFSWWQTKPVLRMLAARRLPRRVATRRKSGFGVPVAAWFCQPAFRDFARDVLARARIVDGPVAASFLEAHGRGPVDHGHRLFALLMLETWFASLPERRAVVSEDRAMLGRPS
ncbi:MAG: asparagine synthase (glutamine-hydrolyzing) [Planctomycetota bacterium]